MEKTYAALELGRECYENVAYFNFETPPRLSEAFAEDIRPEYHIIVAGSLLGVAVNREEFSFPVGKVDIRTMYPMDMEEFMIALGKEELAGQIRECFAETGDYILVRHTQDTILASYLNDMSKYNNLNEIKKTRLTYDNITVQLSPKNTRFQYKLIKKGRRA